MDKENYISQLSTDIEKEAIQRTNKAETKKGYNTTGYGYQWCVDRFNDVLGDKWGFEWEIIKEINGQYRNGTPFYELVIKLGIWANEKETIRYCAGGHTAMNYTDALKGAITNAFKKTAAFWGVGAKAFRGMIDDDANIPEPDTNRTNIKKNDYEIAQEKMQALYHQIGESKLFDPDELDDIKNQAVKAKTAEDLQKIHEEWETVFERRKAAPRS